MDLEKIHVRSDEVQDLMSFIPGSIVRWGITVIFLSLMCALFVAWHIQYPDIITGRISIVSSPLPIDLISRASGNLSLQFQDQSIVTTGTHIAFIAAAADVDDIYKLQRQLDKFQELLPTPHSLTNIVFDKTASLGSLQETYNDFIKNLVSYQLIVSHFANNSSQRISSAYGDHISDLIHKRNILLEEFEIAVRKLKSNQELRDKGIISELKLAEYEENFKKIKTTLEYTNADIEYVKNNLILTIELECKKLESQISAWENQYAIIAPIDGVVSLFEFWNNNQFISIGDNVLTIIPTSSEIYGKLYLPVAGSGKVEISQKVLIKCDSYPFREYGYINGIIKSISLVPQNNQYIVKVSLPNGLTTNYKKKLDFKHEMEGTASIITRKDRLITRIFQHFRHFFNSNF